MPLLGSRAVFTPTLLACYGITAAVHVASIVLNTLLPFHVVDLGGTKTQVGLLFSVMTIVSMFLRPTVGGWVDRFGARPVIAPGRTDFGAPVCVVDPICLFCRSRLDMLLLLHQRWSPRKRCRPRGARGRIRGETD